MIWQSLVWGVLMGAGAALHCAGMCGPIGCALLTATDARQSVRPAWQRLAVMQIGRVLAYVALGLVFGAFGAGLIRQIDMSPVHMALQWLAAGVVIWMGLSTAGLVPSLAGFDRALAPMAGLTARVRFALSQGGPELDLVSGLVWGLTPCPLVYAAVFNSMVLGSVEMAMLMMLAFGLVTAVPVMASSLLLFGAGGRRNRPGHLAAGLMMAGMGVLAFLLTTPGSPLCIS